MFLSLATVATDGKTSTADRQDNTGDDGGEDYDGGYDPIPSPPHGGKIFMDSLLIYCLYHINAHIIFLLLKYTHNKQI